jgi:glycosyltransferase involved in cell wall biosynthesis
MIPTISYLVFSHEEGASYLEPLIQKILRLKEPDDELVIVDDNSTDVSTKAVLARYEGVSTLSYHALDNDFAAHKNYGKGLCTKNLIFQIDGDELPHDNLIGCMKEIFLLNNSVQLIRIPRINMVQGLTDDDIKNWGWRLNDKSWINFPDYQDRVFLNCEQIKWEGKVHEKVTGHLTNANLPEYEDYCLLHIKSIDRQREQNEKYSRIIR